jgi:hypothetical protein
VHDPRPVAVGELGLDLKLAVVLDKTKQRPTHNAVPQRTVIPENHVLLCVVVRVDVLRSDDGTHQAVHEGPDFSEILDHCLGPVGTVLEV